MFTLTGCNLLDDGARNASKAGRAADDLDPPPGAGGLDDVIPPPAGADAAATKVNQEVNSASPESVTAACFGWSQSKAQGELGGDASIDERVAKATEAALEDLAASGHDPFANIMKTQAIIKAFGEYERTGVGTVDLTITQACNLS